MRYLLTLLLLLSGSVLAAPGVVRPIPPASTFVVYAEPSLLSGIMDKGAIGGMIEGVSPGWYKVRIPTSGGTALGWVPSTSVKLQGGEIEACDFDQAAPRIDAKPVDFVCENHIVGDGMRGCTLEVRYIVRTACAPENLSAVARCNTEVEVVDEKGFKRTEYAKKSKPIQLEQYSYGKMKVASDFNITIDDIVSAQLKSYSCQVNEF